MHILKKYPVNEQIAFNKELEELGLSQKDSIETTAIVIAHSVVANWVLEIGKLSINKDDEAMLNNVLCNINEVYSFDIALTMGRIKEVIYETRVSFSSVGYAQETTYMLNKETDEPIAIHSLETYKPLLESLKGLVILSNCYL